MRGHKNSTIWPHLNCLKMLEFELSAFNSVGWKRNDRLIDNRGLILNSTPMTNLWTGLNSKHLQTKKINVAEKLNFVLGRVENIVGKGENAGYQHFLLFPQCFQQASFSRSLKVGFVW